VNTIAESKKVLKEYGVEGWPEKWGVKYVVYFRKMCGLSSYLQTEDGSSILFLSRQAAYAAAAEWCIDNLKKREKP